MHSGCPVERWDDNNQGDKPAAEELYGPPPRSLGVERAEHEEAAIRREAKRIDEIFDLRKITLYPGRTYGDDH